MPVTAPPSPDWAPRPTDTTALDGADVIEPVQRRLPSGVRREGDLIVATIGKAIEIEVDRPFQDVVVPQPEVAEVVVLQPGKVFVATRGVGSTNLLLVDADGHVIRNIEVVVEADLDGLRRTLATMMPGSRVEVTPTQSGVVLTGQVESAAQADNAARVAAQFAGGETDDVINSLAVAGDQQVLLKVRVAEMSRTTSKFLGAQTNFDVSGLESGTILGDNLGNLLTGAMLGGSLGTGVPNTIVIDKFGIDGINFDALEEQDLIKVLAEPTLTAISGETANFLVGGEFPVPVAEDEDDRILIEFKEFGVSLSFTPVVLSDNQISLRIQTEVSRIAEEISFTTEGNILIPGLSVRRAASTVMLPSGGSLMIAGLLRDEERNSIQGTPGLMDLPILGALFRSTEFLNERTEMVVLVQAFKVRPREFGPEFSLPTDGFVPADDIDIYLFGKLYEQYGGGPGQRPRPAFTMSAPIGYMME
ncbi:type II and III secretion system protein family protein [Roseospira visakhapatnamensis]|uniref:Pilus assembly protein CpaC n=1 Tax=Roseospira visakhapatnamensis TaxID=390880 RepID=A0A7W6RFF7_9PROT|nr:type II and III secretion system protein family protein [Roseospira visakhapatnamensis]MBB4267566.1 pilus assembly protein CpaC [Roseospira visakhapatnamensis]